MFYLVILHGSVVQQLLHTRRLMMSFCSRTLRKVVSKNVFHIVRGLKCIFISFGHVDSNLTNQIKRKMIWRFFITTCHTFCLFLSEYVVANEAPYTNSYYTSTYLHSLYYRFSEKNNNRTLCAFESARLKAGIQIGFFAAYNFLKRYINHPGGPQST